MDGGQAVAQEFQRLTAQISSQLAGLNKPNDGAAAAAIAVQRQQAKTAIQLQKEVTTAVVSENGTRAKATETAVRSELTSKQQLAAAASLQRQRSAALISQWKQEERAALQAASGVRPLRDVLQQLSGSIAIFQGPLGPVAGRLSAFGAIAGNASSQLSEMGTAATAGGASIASMAGPIGIAVAALAAEIGVVVLLTKEIFNLAKASADYQGKLFDLSQQTGVSVETLSALEVVARTTGSSVDALAASLGIFQRHLEDANDPASKAAKIFRDLNVDASDTEGALRQTIAALAQMPEGFEQTAAALEVFGRGGKAFLAIAKESNGDIDEITKRLKDLGLVTTAQAKLADEFNDQLVILDVQMRGLGTKAIPVVLDVLRDLSKGLEDNREIFLALQGIIKAVALTISVPLRTAVGFIKTEFDKVQFVLGATAALFERIKQAIEFISGHPVTFPGLSQPTTGDNSIIEDAKRRATTALSAASGDKAFREGLFQEIADQKKLQAVLNFGLAETQRLAEAKIALAQREFDAGKRTRQQLLEATIQGSRQQTKAQLDALQEERDIKLKEAALESKDVEKRTKISNDILAIDTQIAAKRDDLRQKEADLRAKAQLDERKAELAHHQARTDDTIRQGEIRIAAIQDLLKREQVDREVALQEIEFIENKSIQARGQLLKFELSLAGVGPDRQVVLDKIKAIETERTALERQQSERRKQISQGEFETKRQIDLSRLDTLLQIEQIRGNARIATIQALAGLGVKTEEQAAREILAVRLRLLDNEIEAAKAKQADAAGISDAAERKRIQTETTNQIKILNAEREALQDEGNRDIDEGRKEDLENERRYARELQEIQERITDIERDGQRETILLMQLHFANRKDIIRAQRDLELAEEEDRHSRVTDSLNQQEREVDEEIRILESHLQALKIGTTEEIEQHERLIAKLEKLRLKREQLKLQQDAEDQRSQTRKRRVTDEGTAALEREEPISTRSLFGDSFKEQFDAFKQAAIEAGQPISDLNAGFQALAQSSADAFHKMSKDQGNFASFAKEAFGTLAQGIGQIVESYVLLGETGPSVMRKLFAQVLATLAKEAAVKAIFELAEGFAMLFVNPAAAGAHFTAAAIYGSVAGVAAIAGRSVAGDLFKQKTASAGGLSSSQGSGQLNTITQNRNQPQVQIIRHEHTFRVESNDSHIVKIVSRDLKTGGSLREFAMNDGIT